MHGLVLDIRSGWRTVTAHPGFALLATLTLALGIGANTTIFSVLHATLLRPRPFEDPDRLVVIGSFKLRDGQPPCCVSLADFGDWRAQARSFSDMAAWRGEGISYRDANQAEVFPAARVGPGFFTTFGTAALMGRTFLPDEEETATKVVVLSHALWMTRFGGDPSILGKDFNLDGVATTVIGVMPREFRQPDYAQAWVPLGSRSPEWHTRANRYFQAVGRLAPGVDATAARTEMATLAARLEVDHPSSNQGWSVELIPLREHLVKDVRAAVLLLQGAVGFVLLIACANIAALLLARAAGRSREMALRQALGAGRGRLLRQLLTESLLLAVAGGSVGLLLAWAGVETLPSLLPESSGLQRAGLARIDGNALLFTASISLLTGMFFGLVPGWQASRLRLSERLGSGARGTAGPGRSAVHRVLIAVQFAFALVLLVGAGLLLQSFLRLRGVDPGYEARNLLLLPVSAPFSRSPTDADRVRFYQRLEEAARSVPGVEGTALTSGLPFGFLNFPFNVEGEPLAGGDATVRYSAISPDYFQVLRTPLQRGRTFDARDTIDSPPVALINSALARIYFGGRDPIGRTISIAYLGRRLALEIVGISDDILQDGAGTGVHPEVFVPAVQFPWFGAALVIRTGPPPDAMRLALQRAIWSVDAQLPVSRATTAEALLATATAEPRLHSTLLAGFAAIALALAGVGIYGVTAYSVTQRTQEIGIRAALGARPQDLLWLVVRDGMTPALIGVGLGFAGALAITRLMSQLLFGIEAHDSLTFVAVGAVLSGIAFVACLLPGWQALRLDPVRALRSE